MVRRIIKYFFPVSAHSVDFIILNLWEKTVPRWFQALSQAHLLTAWESCAFAVPWSQTNWSKPPRVLPKWARYYNPPRDEKAQGSNPRRMGMLWLASPGCDLGWTSLVSLPEVATCSFLCTWTSPGLIMPCSVPGGTSRPPSSQGRGRIHTPQLPALGHPCSPCLFLTPFIPQLLLDLSKI